MFELKVPRENVNDDTVIVVDVRFKSGATVKKGDCIFELETTKAAIEIDAPVSGVIRHDVSEGDPLPVGELLCRIDDGSAAPSEAESMSAQNPEPKVADNLKISRRARERAAELGVDLSIFVEGMVTIADIEQAAAGKTAEGPAPTKAGRAAGRNNRLVVLGAGGHAKMCIDILKQRNEYEIVGIVDSQKPVGHEICGVKVIGDESALEELWHQGVGCAINGVGAVTRPGVRKEVFDRLKNIGFFIPNLVHPSAVVEPSATMGEGNQIMMGACLGSDASLGDNCIVNSGSVVSHDCRLHDHSHVAPGAILAGEVTVGEIAVVGMGATVYIGVKLGAKAMINNGINVFRDVAPGEIMNR